jgi:hypothetical protein
MFTYEIKQENGKYNIYYYIDNKIETIEFYAYDLSNPQAIIRYGYKQKIN